MRKVTVSMPEWLWNRVSELNCCKWYHRTCVAHSAHDDQTQKVVPKCCHKNRSESLVVQQHGMAKQRLAVCARHTKNARTKRRAKSSTRNHKCVAGPLHLTIWWWASSVLRFGWPVVGFVSSRSTDMLQNSHRPQKMMPCSGISL